MFQMRIAVRQIARAPVFAGAVVVTLSLVFGINVAALDIVWQAYLRPLPHPEPERLVALFVVDQSGGLRSFSLPDFLDVEARSKSLATVAALRRRTFNARHGASPDQSRVIAVAQSTGRFFDVLMESPLSGRLFRIEDERQQLPVTVVTHALASTWFGDVSQAVGTTIALNEISYTIVGVTRPGFTYRVDGGEVEAFVPVPYRDYLPSRGARPFTVIGRLSDPATHDSAHTEVKYLGQELASQYPTTNKDTSMTALSLVEVLRGNVRRPMLSLVILSITVTLLALANVFSLALARALRNRATSRIKSMLGATRRTLLFDVGAEAVLLVAVALGVGVLLKSLTDRAMLAAFDLGPLTQPAPFAGAVPFTAAVIAIIAAAALLSMSVPATAPMLRKTASRISNVPSPAQSRYALSGAVIAQVTMATSLMVVTGILVSSFWELLSIDPGFRSERVVRFGIGLPEVRYDSDDKLARFHTSLLDGLADVPQVTCAGAVFRLPLAGRVSPGGLTFVPPTGASEKSAAAVNVASPDYFRCLSIALESGRFFEPHDILSRPRVAIVNEAFRQRFGVPDVLGRQVTLSWSSQTNPRGVAWEIVGVVADTRQLRLDVRAEPELFLPVAQFPPDGASYVLKLQSLDSSVLEAIRAHVRRSDSQLQLVNVQPVDNILSDATGIPRRVVSTAGVLTALGSR